MAKWAILIGIDYYNIIDCDEEDDQYFQHPARFPLHGCVQDVEDIKKILLDRWGFQPSNIISLTSPGLSSLSPQDNTAQGEKDAYPTYYNIIRVISSMEQRANAGDVVYIHFSGYTINLPPVLPHLQATQITESALLPVNVMEDGICLRDLELALLLRNLVNDGLEVTLIVDGRNSLKTSISSSQISTFSEEELRSVSHGPWSKIGRNTWLQDPDPEATLTVFWLNGATLRSAFVSEYLNPESHRWNGFLTNKLLPLLETSNPHCTYTVFRDELVNQLEGIGLTFYPNGYILAITNMSRPFLGGITVLSLAMRCFPTLLVDDGSASLLRIRGGASHGLWIGQRFILITNPYESPGREGRIVLGSFRLTTVEESSSTAHAIDFPGSATETCRLENKLLAMCATVTSTGLGQDSAVLHKPKGTKNIPKSSLDDTNIQESMLPLSHDVQAELYAYYLSSGDSRSEFAHGLRVSVVGGYGYTQTGPPRVPFLDGGGHMNMATGDYAVIQISSWLTAPLSILIFCFDSAFGISKVYPIGHKDKLKQAASQGWDRSLHLRLAMPSVRLGDESIRSTTEVLKIIVSDVPMASSVPELPSIGDRRFLQEHKDPARFSRTQESPSPAPKGSPSLQIREDHSSGCLFSEDLDDSQNWAVYTIPFVLHKSWETVRVT